MIGAKGKRNTSLLQKNGIYLFEPVKNQGVIDFT